MNNERIFLSSPHLTGEEQKYVKKAFDTNWIAPLGENVDMFEKEIADYTGIGGAVALSSGSAGLHLSLILLGVTQGDTVFCSSLTFVASANPILYQGAEPVFIDSEPDSWNMSPEALERAFESAKKMNKLPKAVLVANLYGQSADMDRLLDICDTYHVPLIEDAAESLGASYKGKKSGTFGKFGVFSFNGNKIITTSGGGMLVSEDLELLNRARFLATQAREKALHYEHTTVGYNYRLSNISAGIGRGQLEVLDERVNARRKVNSRYREAFSGMEGVSFMSEPEGYFSTFWLSAMTFDREKFRKSPHEIVKELEQFNIECRPVWKPMHLQPLFEENQYFSHKESESISDKLFANGLCLPSGSNMSVEQQEFVIEKLLQSLKK
ncbi:DegT/DnrJ/EryC1/StrS family aminotransferase [Metabacillus halosaccharovorans]|uniref:DegT/DnrJ/EryC1/StrS family aminotransferase n=1 Tax=Metabacillus halosaccharovorans TaxID=930124 RepID=UPI003736F07C